MIQPAPTPVRTKRRGAIVYAEVLAGSDPARTGQVLVPVVYREIVRPLLAQYGGECLKLTAKAIVIEAADPFQACACALGLLRNLAERNAKVAPADVVLLRVGLHAGDIVPVGREHGGEAAHVALHLRGLAEPGELCVSVDIFERLSDKAGLFVRALGPQNIANIARRIPAFRLSHVPFAVHEVKVDLEGDHPGHVSQDLATIGMTEQASHAHVHAVEPAHAAPAVSRASHRPPVVAAPIKTPRKTAHWFGGLIVGGALIIAVIKGQGYFRERANANIASKAPPVALAPAPAPALGAASIPALAPALAAASRPPAAQSLLTPEELRNKAEGPGLSPSTAVAASVAQAKPGETAAASPMAQAKSSEAAPVSPSPPPRKTVESAAKSCDLNDASGCTALAAAYSKGDGVQVSQEKAETLLHKACGLNDGEACLLEGFAKHDRTDTLKGCRILGLQRCMTALGEEASP